MASIMQNGITPLLDQTCISYVMVVYLKVPQTVNYATL